MRVCVATTVHHPEDARILHRQIRALLDAGHEVTYVAPFTHCNVTPAPPITPIDVPRAAGLGRSLRAARTALRRASGDSDLLLLHDLGLLLALPFRHPPVVLDLPAPSTDPLGRILESRALCHHHVIRRHATGAATHAVVPDGTLVSGAPVAPGQGRVVHLGRLTAQHGVNELIDLAQRLVPYGVRLDLLGEADAEARTLLRDAQRVGLLDWYGYVPHRHAVRMAEGALAGLSLGHPGGLGPPAKILDYMGRGLPVVTTPGGAGLVEEAGCGVVVPYGDVDAALRAVLDLKNDPVRRAALGGRGHAEARLSHHWPDHAPRFVALLEGWAAAPEGRGQRGRRPEYVVRDAPGRS
ncbi:glycosyltransferase [Nonomuraea sp. NPDC046570]|uniref:glycosyltransferase n=1 Tax=Nonomuraea sp. NPDC046570 TaxID=3155255 RepID=UPI00340BB595